MSNYKCKLCGIDTSEKRKDRREFCCYPHFIEYRKLHDPKWQLKTISCKNCGKHCEVKQSEPQMFCSRSCSASTTNIGKKASQSKILKLQEAYKNGRLTGLQENQKPKACRTTNKEKIVKQKVNVPKIEKKPIYEEKNCPACQKLFLTTINRKRNKSYCCIKCAYTSPGRGGYRPGSVRSYKSGFHESKIAGKVWLDSSYEFIMAQYLDSKNYTWNKNHQKFPYINTKGETKNYVPDFYVKELDLWIETKGMIIDDDYLKWKAFPYTLEVIKKSDIKHPETWGF